MQGLQAQFSLKVGTIFEDSPLGWDKWLPAVWLLANSKNSISSHELGRALGITQKSAWFVLHRLRDAMATGSFERMSGITEVDDTFIGGLAKNMHRKARKQQIHGTGGIDKMIVQGARNRATSGTLPASSPESTASPFRSTSTSGWRLGRPCSPTSTGATTALRNDFALKPVNHARGEYVCGDVHTNGIENFWSPLKRSIKGAQIHVAAAHLHRYVNERTFAYNHRETGDLGRMQVAMAGVAGRRVTWEQLTERPAA